MSPNTCNVPTGLVVALVAGVLALIVGEGLGVQSHTVPNDFSNLPRVSCGTTYMTSGSDDVRYLYASECAATAVAPLRTMSWLLTIAGGLTVIGGGIALARGSGISISNHHEKAKAAFDKLSPRPFPSRN